MEGLFCPSATVNELGGEVSTYIFEIDEGIANTALRYYVHKTQW